MEGTFGNQKISLSFISNSKLNLSVNSGTFQNSQMNFRKRENFEVLGLEF